MRSFELTANSDFLSTTGEETEVNETAAFDIIPDVAARAQHRSSCWTNLQCESCEDPVGPTGNGFTPYSVDETDIVLCRPCCTADVTTMLDRAWDSPRRKT